MENKSKVILKLVCPICSGEVWEHIEHIGEFRCAKCGEVFYCEQMIAMSDDVKGSEENG